MWKNEGEDLSSLETTLTSLKITEENELLAVTNLAHDSSGYLDLGIEKLAYGTGDRRNKAIIDTKGPTNEEKGQILTKNNGDQIIISRIEREEFGKNELGNYDHVSNGYTGLIELNKDHDSFETFITREKYIDPNKVFQMNESLYATSGSKLLKLEKEVKPFKPKFEWDFPLWMRLNVPMDYSKPYEG